MTINIQNYQLEIDEPIETLLNHFCNISSTMSIKLLNTNNFSSVVEKFIYDIALFHFKKMNIIFDENKYIEFWFKDKHIENTGLHVDCDEYDRVVNKNKDFSTPLLSCIIYLNDNMYVPTIITNIDREMHEEIITCDIKKNLSLCLSFPKKWKHITFDGGKYYHGACNIIDNFLKQRKILLINLWDKKPMNVPYFNYDYIMYKNPLSCDPNGSNIFDISQNNFNTQIIESTTIPKIITLKSNTINEKIYRELFSRNYKNLTDIIKIPDLEKLIDDCDIIYLENAPSSETVVSYQSCSVTLHDIPINPSIMDCNVGTSIDCSLNNEMIAHHQRGCDNSCKNNRLLPVNLSRWKQRFIIPNHFSKDVCKWIVNECEEYASNNGGWTTICHKNYPTTDIPANKIPCIYRFILTSFIETIQKYIVELYCLKDFGKMMEFDIRDIFIVKYEEGKQDYLEIHQDGTTISVNILLNDTSEFIGGGTFFIDDITTNVNQGDMLIHSGMVKHSGSKITSGKRYILVFFINIMTV